MATFASSSLAKTTSEINDEEAEAPSTSTQPKRILTQEVSSILGLQSELLKAKERAAKLPQRTDYRSGNKGVLHVKKDEKASLKAEAAQRKAHIKELGRELEREEAERLATIQRVMTEKSALYDKLSKGKVMLTNPDNTPVDFMVDFITKKRQNQEETRMREEFEPTAEPSTSSEVQPEHYVPDEERRVYGASHVRFSQNEEKRKKQMDDLLKMSDDTAAAREKNKSVMAKREQVKRMKVARMREKMGLPPLKDPTPPPEVDLTEIPLPDDIEEEVEKQHQKRIKSDREWDRGKDRYHRWIEKEREERNDEFAPPKFY
ncbi:unnamed protein product [Auanema sp. JU1783]|nr:unnamed protein product [Auanema sp. JU1783]